jgi:hypothetical protein
MTKTLNDIVKTLKAKGYIVYTQPYKLNIVGIRNSERTRQDVFDDLIAFFYYDDKGNLIGKIATGTTDPSAEYLMKPISGVEDKGTAILKSGQYVDTYAIGMHRNKYEAVIQTLKPVEVIRDNDRNALINYFAPTEKGFFGINLHRASVGKNNPDVISKDSAGCQVFRDETDFQLFMNMARKSRDAHGNKFTYTLIDERDIIKQANTLLLGLAFVGAALYLYKISK